MPSLSEQLAGQLADPVFGSAELVSPEQLTGAGRRQIPSWWPEAALLDNSEAMEVAVAQGSSALPGKLAISLEVFRTRSAGLHLARLGIDSPTVVLIYALHSGSADEDADPFVCWYGYPPKAQLASGRVDAERLPAGVRLLYTKLHNSFCLAGFGSTGFIRSDEMFVLDGDADDYEYESDRSRRPEPARLVPLLLSARGNLCGELTDVADGDQETAWMAYDSTLEDLGPLWAALDERIVKFCSPFD